MYSICKIKEKGRAMDRSRLVAATAPKASAWLMPPPVGVMHPLDETLRHAHRMGSAYIFLEADKTEHASVVSR